MSGCRGGGLIPSLPPNNVSPPPCLSQGKSQFRNWQRNWFVWPRSTKNGLLLPCVCVAMWGEACIFVLLPPRPPPPRPENNGAQTSWAGSQGSCLVYPAGHTVGLVLGLSGRPPADCSEELPSLRRAALAARHGVGGRCMDVTVMGNHRVAWRFQFGPGKQNPVSGAW